MALLAKLLLASLAVAGCLFSPLMARADVNASKASAFVVLGPQPGVSVTKASAFVVLGPQPGVSVTKANAFAVLGPVPGVSVSKTIAYVVLKPQVKSQPSINIFTKNGMEPLAVPEFMSIVPEEARICSAGG